MTFTESILEICGLLGLFLWARFYGYRIWPFAIVTEPIYLLIEAIRRRWKGKKR